MAHDIRFASGAVHDDLGPITSFVAETERGRRWLADWAGDDFANGAAIIETDAVPLVIQSIEGAGLSVVAA